MSYVHASVTEKLVEKLKEGVVPWRHTWALGGTSGVPRNVVSNRPYSGVNVLLLWFRMLEEGYSDKRWLTFNQVKELGGSVKNQKAARIVFFGESKRKDDGEEGESYRFAKLYNLFNTEQVEGIDFDPEIPLKPFEVRLENAQALVEAQGIQIIHGGDRASYNATQDVIVLPPLQAFESEEAYWATALHELAHATAHKARLNREVDGIDLKARAFEELVAELASCFVCADLGITPMFDNSAGYIEHWTQHLMESERAIFKAASEASRVAQYLQAQAVPLTVAA